MGTKSFKTKNSIVTGSFASDPVDGQNGEVYYNTTTGELRKFTNGAWRNIGDGGLVPVVQNTLANNQSVAANITGLQVTGTKAAKLDYTIRRNHAAVPGTTYDTAYNANLGLGFLLSANGGSVETFRQLSDGRVLIGGTWNMTNKSVGTNACITCLNNDGTLNTATNANIGTGVNDIVRTLVASSVTDKTLFGGNGIVYNGTSCRIGQINSNGTLDTAFNANLGTGPNQGCYGIAVQADGKIVWGGFFTTWNGAARNRMVRTNADGTEDAAFYANLGTGFNGMPRVIVIQPADQKIIALSDFTTFNGLTRNKMIRLNPDGTEDTAWYANLGTAIPGGGLVTACVIQADGKAIIGGTFSTFNGNTRKIFRLNTDGTEDATFQTNIGTGPNNNVWGMHQQADGKIIVSGSFTSWNGNNRGKVVRLNADGTEDTAFSAAVGAGWQGQSNAVQAFQKADGNIMLGASSCGGFSGNYGVVNLVQVSSAGVPSTSWINTYGATAQQTSSGQTRESVLLSSGKVLNIGQMDTLNGNVRRGPVVINADGTEDTAWTAAVGNFWFQNTNWAPMQSFCGMEHSDGSIYIGGQIGFVQGTGSYGNVVKLSAAGVVNAAFKSNIGSGFNDIVWACTYQPADGKTLWGGRFSTFNGNSRRLVRLNTDGTEDTAFATNVGSGTGGTGDIRSIKLQADGKILVAGTFTSWNGATRNRLVRLNVDGTEDTAFYTNLGTGFNSDVWRLLVQSNGQILVMGAFTTLSGNTRNRMVRLNPTGFEDSAFYTNLGTGFNNNVYSAAINSAGVIYVGGQFTTINGVTTSGIARLSSAGVPDNSLYAGGITPVVNIQQVLIQADQKVLFFPVGSAVSPAGITPPRGLGRINADLAASNVAKTGQLWLQYNDVSATWEIGGETSMGTDPGVVLSVDATGQVKYTSSNLVGTLQDSYIRWLLTKI